MTGLLVGFSRDLDSVSRESVDSGDIIDNDSTLRREDGHSTGNQLGI